MLFRLTVAATSISCATNAFVTMPSPAFTRPVSPRFVLDERIFLEGDKFSDDFDDDVKYETSEDIVVLEKFDVADEEDDTCSVEDEYNFPFQLTWEPMAAKMIRKKMAEKDSDKPFMVGIVGIPGSGKSTSVFMLNQILSKDGCIMMPHDGYHYDMDTLRSLENPEDMIYRRGAPDTFDPEALARDLQRIRDGPEKRVHIPGFDHALGDPEPDFYTFSRDDHKLVICEGLYLLHDNHGWHEIKEFFDFTIFVEANVDACVERVKARNKCIPGYTPEEIELRTDLVDRVNAITVNESRKYADLTVESAAGK